MLNEHMMTRLKVSIPESSFVNLSFARKVQKYKIMNVTAKAKAAAPYVWIIAK